MKWMSVILFVAFGSISFAKVTEVNQSMIQNVLETFSRDCTFANGPSSEAIDLVKSLSQTLKSINDPNCNSALGAVAALEAARVEAEGYLAGIPNDLVNDVDKNSRRLQRKKEEIVSLMSTTTDPAEMTLLRNELITTQLELAQASSERDSREQIEATYRRARSLRTLVLGTNAAIDQMLNNRECWLKKPGVLQNVAGIGSAIGYSVAMSSPNTEIGFLVSAGMQIVSRTIDFFIKLAREEDVDQFQVSIQPLAMTCALQKMNRIYCEAQDTVKAIDTVGPNLHKPTKDPIWSGVRILERDIPRAISWIEKLRAGGNPNSQVDARSRLEFQQKEALLDNSVLILNGVFEEMGSLLSGTNDLEDKFKVLKDIISGVVAPLCPPMYGPSTSPSVGNPMCDINDYYQAVYFLLGVTPEQMAQIQANNRGALPAFTGGGGLSLSMLRAVGVEPTYQLSPIRDRFTNWHDRAKQRFTIVKNRVIGTDLQLIFDEGITGSRYMEERSETPLGSFRIIYNFIEKTKSDATSAGELDLRKNTLESLQIIISAMEKVANQEEQLDSARTLITKAANLVQGSSFLRSRIDRLVKRQLQILVEDRNYIPDDVTLRLLAANDYISVLQGLFSNSSLAEIKGKALAAQGTIQRALPGFLNLFQPSIKESMTQLSQSQDQFRDSNQASKFLKTSLCFYLLQSPRWNDRLNMQSCIGLQEISPIGIETPKFAKALFNKPYEERSCLYNNYIRKNRVYEKRNVQPSPAVKNARQVDSRELKKVLLKKYL